MLSTYKAFFGLILFQCNLLFAQGKIIMNGATMNAINSAYVVTTDVSLTNAGTLNINNSTIKIAGSINAGGSFDVTKGTVEMNGTTNQAIPVAAFASNKIMNLVISNNVDLGGQDSITGQLSFGNANNKTFATAGYLTLRSTSLGTARVADITNAGTNTGNVVTGAVKIERYISAHRAWRLLTSPVNVIGSQAIRDAWQEGVNNTTLNYALNQNPVPGYGTHITWGNAVASGFDAGINNNSGLKGYNTLTGAWDALTNTNTIHMTDYPAYMVFVRGDRSINLAQGINAPPTPTTLRSTGILKSNIQSFAVSATGFTVISNPYASAMDLNNIAKNASSANIQDNFYLWDPKITGSNGVGGFVNFSWDTINHVYDITPFTGDGISQYISSGAAFLAKSADSSTAGTLVVKEVYKTVLNSDNVNRPATAVTVGKLVTNLYSINADGTTSIVDGLLNSFGNAYANAIDNNDAVKLSNFSENLSTLRNGKALTVERRQPLLPTDTIFLNMLNMKVKPYKFEFIATNLFAGNLTGFLEDTYLHTSTPVDLNSTTIFNFTIAAIPGSWNPSRFRIVFRPMEVLPVTFNLIKAFQQDDDIKVQWKIENATEIKQYDLEKSLTGQQFTMAAEIMADSNADHTTYNWLDENPFTGYNYYRVKSKGFNGESYYSSIVKVYMAGRQRIIVPTRQLANGYIDFNFLNMPAGSYKVSLFTILGQLLATKKVEHQQGSESQHIELNSNSPKGEYMLEIIKPGNKKLTNKIYVY